MALTKAGTGTLTLSGSNITYSGPTTIIGGTLSLVAPAAGGAVLSASTPITVNSGLLALSGGINAIYTNPVTVNAGGAINCVRAANLGLLTLSGGTASGTSDVTYGTWFLVGGVHATGGATSYLTAPNMVLNAANTFTVDSGATLDVTGFFWNSNGSNALTKAGPGAPVTSGSNTYAGATIINAGTVTITGSGCLANTNAITIAPGTTLNLGGANNNEIQQAASGGTLNVGGLLDVTTNTAHTLYASTIALSGGTLTSSQSVPTYGAFFVGGGGGSRTITASGAGNTISAVNFGIQGGDTLTNHAMIQVDLGQTYTNSGQIAGDATTILTLGASAVFSVSHSSQMNLAGAVTGSGALSLTGDGSGTLVLAGTNSYTGGTYVDEGTLIVDKSAAAADGTSLTVGAGGVFIFDPTATSSSLGADSHVASSSGVAAVPEPGTLALLGMAGIVAAAAAWRRRKGN